MKNNQLIHLAWTALLGSLLAVSCQTALETDIAEKHISYDCTLQVNLDETRTANNGAGTVWVADDALTVMHTDNGSTFYTSRFYYSGENNAFKGRVTDVGEVNDWYMFYPYSDNITTPKSVQITVPGTQTQTGNSSTAHLAGPNFPLFGKQLQQGPSQNLSVTMANLLGVIKFRVNNNTNAPIVVKRIALATPVQVSGTFTGDLTASTIRWTASGTTSANLTLNIADGASIAAGQEESFYIGTVPFTAPAGTQMKIKITAVHPSNPSAEIDYYEVLTLRTDNTVSPNTQKAFPVSNFDEYHQTDPGSGTPTIKTDQNLAFANANLTWTLGSQFALNGVYDMPQQVAGAQTAVTYSSSNTRVISITNGRFRIEGVGSTTINAHAAETDQYNPADASYTLTVTEAAVTPTSRTYKYVAPGDDLVAGTYVITGSEDGELSAALFPTVEVGSWSSSTGNVTNGEKVPHKVIGTNNSVESFTTEDADIINGEVELSRANTSGTATWKIKVKANGKFLGTPAQNYRINYVDEASAAAFSISGGSGSSWGGSWGGSSSTSATVQTGSYYFYHTGSGDGFTFRTSSTSNIRFYQLDASKQNQSISFANPTVTWTLGSTYAVGNTYSLPQVSGAMTTVTYTSSNPNVATVSGTNVTIVGAGTTTITASAAETSSYYGATATMTLVIENGSVTPPTPTENAYVKVTEELPNWAGTYLFVDESSSKAFAAFSANASSYAVNVTISNNQIAATSDIAKYALTVTDAGVQHANVSGQEAYDVRNSDGKYIYYSSSALQIADTNTKTSSGSGWGSSSTTTAYHHAFKYFNASNNTPAGVQVLSSGHSSGYNKYYLGYVNSAFSYSNESADGRRVQLYKLSEGTTPTPGKQDQVLSFAEPSVTRTMETASGTLAVQTVTGNKTTPVTYSSSNPNVATVNGTTITITGFGSTQIIATAPSSSTYNQGTASYTLNIVQSTPAQTGTVYTKATSLTVGGTYLIVDVADQRLFKGETDGSFVNITPSNGVINDTNNSYAGYEFTVTQSGSKYCLMHNNQYLINDYTMNSSTGLVYESTKPEDRYLYGYTVHDNGVFEFSTDQRGSGNTGEVLYYKTSNNVFKIGGSGKGVGVHLYLKTSGSVTPSKQNQNPYFASSAVTQTMATASGTLQVQSVQGAQGTVTYSSSNTSVATVNGTTLTIRGFGQTTITANAAGNDSYNPGSASYTLTIAQSGSTGGTAYVKATSLTVGGTYLVVDVADQRLFTAATDGSFVSVSPSGGVITDNNGTMSGYEFTVTQSGSKYCIMHNNQYLINDYTMNSSTGLVYESTKPEDRYLYGYTVHDNGVFEFSTDQRGSGNTGEVLYYKTSNSVFKIGGSGKGVGVHLYLKESGSTTSRQQQNLSFAQSTVTWTLGTDGNVGTVKTGQSVQNAKTSPVTYTSSDRNVATVNGTQITIVAAGTTTITATAPMNDNYYEGSASYTLNILPSSGVMVYNIENDRVKGYLDRVEANPYNPADYSYTYMTNEYYGGMSASNRLDWPKPVPVNWTNPTSGNTTKTVYVYNDSAMNNLEMSVTNISSTATSANVYNLIPGKTYYYKVVNGTNGQLSTGSFMTTGRRRMMKVGDDYGNNYANNCRDFGGQVTTNGKKVKFGKIYRGSNMDNTSSTAREYLKGYMNIGLDLDLRSTGEHRNPLNVTCPTPGYNDWSTGNSGLRNVSNMQTTLNAVFDAVEAGKGVYIHCAIGADRTGYVCMLLEAILGVSQGNCDVDYEMTSFSCVGTKTRTGTGNYYYVSYSGWGQNQPEARGVDYVNTFNGNTFQDKAIDCLVNYYGISRQRITAFQNAMLE